MSNGNLQMTDHDYIIQIHTTVQSLKEWISKLDNKLDQHLENANCKTQKELTDFKESHSKDEDSYRKNQSGTINTMYIFIFGLPTLLSLVIALIKLFG